MEKPIQMYVKLCEIVPNPLNEQYFARHAPEEYETLKRSIAANGIRDPLKLRKTKDGYVLLGGQTRFAIAKELGMEEVKADIYKNISDHEAEYLLIADNDERRHGDDPIKQMKRAVFLKEYWGVREGKANPKGTVIPRQGQNGPDDGKTLSDVAQAIGESERTTKRLLKLNDLAPEWQALVSAGKLGVTVAEQLAYFPPDVQSEFYNTVREAILEMNLTQIKDVRARVESGDPEEIRRLKHQLELAGKKLELVTRENEERIEKLQAALSEKEAELRRGFAATKKLMDEKAELEKRLKDLSASEKARLDVLEDEIKTLEEQKDALIFEISDLKYELNESKEKRTRTDEGISTLTKKLKLVLDIKGEVEAALNQIEEDPYGNAWRCLLKFAPVLRDMTDLLYKKLDEVARMGNREIPAEIAEKGLAPAVSNVVKFKKEVNPGRGM